MPRSRWLLTATLVLAGAALISLNMGQAGPVEGPKALGQDIPAAEGELAGASSFDLAYRGGQRACVIAMSTARKIPVNMGISVLDEQKNVVAQSVGGRLVAAVWYPPRDANYRIVLSSTAQAPIKAYVVVK